MSNRKAGLIDINPFVFRRFAEAVQGVEPVSGLTHNYYRYPARFSPEFAREAIQVFSGPGDLVFDPFMGGGTTLVEALAAGRDAIGTDISALATFVTTSKTTLLGETSLARVSAWAQETVSETRARRTASKSTWAEKGYQKDIPWPIKHVAEGILAAIKDLPQMKQQRFAQCALLKTAQWAIDCRDETPSASSFRDQFLDNIADASIGMRQFRDAVRQHKDKSPECLILNRSTVGLEKSKEINRLTKKPKLIVTSPPYPGVHVIYHQWQVYSRKRTSAPFWLISSLDGQGSTHYTFGYYKEQRLKRYFETAQEAFASLHEILDDHGIIVQLVGFSNPEVYLPKYLHMMEQAGFKETALSYNSIGNIRRLWRNVPNRKWYADAKGRGSSSREVVLVHHRA